MGACGKDCRKYFLAWAKTIDKSIKFAILIRYVESSGGQRKTRNIGFAATAYICAFSSIG